jgi:flagellar biosynthetic protein FlhB
VADTPEQHEKTEEPTQRKLDDALKKGDVARSHDLPADGESLRELIRVLGAGLLGALTLPITLMIAAGIAGNLIQHRLLFSTEPITPKLSKISPLSGFKRLFSATSLVNFAKGVAKLVIVGAVITAIVWSERDRLDTLISLDPAAILGATHAMAGKVLISVLAILAIVAALDFAWQKHSWWEKQKMTIKELRDEQKQMEGDPQIRAKIRQVRIEHGRKRMMQNVPRAAVVITNPTHFSVALEYEAGMNAPVCVAKGVDAVALRIREIAREHDVPLVENPPLARALHASVEIDDEIPPEHYKAVAEVIGYVMRLKNRVGAKGRA